MTDEILLMRMQQVFTVEQINRIWISHDNSLCIDLHGLNCVEAKRFLNNTINLLREPRRIKVIHGYNHGTALLKMIRQNFKNSHIKAMFSDKHNHGITYLQIA